MISSVASSVYSPSTNATQPSVNRPAPGSSYDTKIIQCGWKKEDKSYKARKIKFDASIRIFDAQFSFLVMCEHSQE